MNKIQKRFVEGLKQTIKKKRIKEANAKLFGGPLAKAATAARATGELAAHGMKVGAPAIKPIAAAIKPMAAAVKPVGGALFGKPGQGLGR